MVKIFFFVLTVTLMACSTTWPTAQAPDDPTPQPPAEPAAQGLDILHPPGFTFLREETFSCGGQTNTVRIYWHEKTGLEFVLVPGGEFMMGVTDKERNERGLLEYCLPQRRVKVKPFLISRTEISNGAYRKYRSYHDSMSYDGLNLDGDTQPVVWVNWGEALSWCEAMGLRLPSEAEWEYACRAGTSTSRFWGDDESETGRYANVADRRAKRKFPFLNISLDIDDGHTATAPVGSYQPNAFGLFDMIGNVWEWCEDNWHDSYEGAPRGGRVRSGIEINRVARGGCWLFDPYPARSASRGRLSPTEKNVMLGFRPAVSL